MDAKDKRYSYKRFGCNSSRVGQAVMDILGSNPLPQEVGETVEAMTPKYFEELFNAASNGKSSFSSPFYVVVLRKKETLAGLASNVLFHRYIARQTKPLASTLRDYFPNYDHDVFEVNGDKVEITHLWTLPTHQDAASILKNKESYDPSLVKWIVDFNSGKLA